MSNAAQRKPGEANPIVQLAILVGIFVAVLNAGFYFISDFYFDDRAKRFGAQELMRLSGARTDFAIFTIVVGAATVLSAMYPRAVAHVIAAVAGLASFLAACAGFASDVSVVLAFTLLVVAGLFGLLIWYSLQQSRAAWSCLAALCAVYGVVTLFGATKIGGLLGQGLWIALIVPGLLATATAALGMIRTAYRDPA